MRPLFIHYPKCGTCRKAAKWLDIQDVDLEKRDIVTHKPTQEELTQWISESGMSALKFFNTSGLVYRELNLKDKVRMMSERDLISLLASDGKLVKRPILVLPNRVLVGFKEQEWQQALAEK